MEQNRQPGNYREWVLGHPFVARVWSHHTLAGCADLIPPRVQDGGALVFEMDTRLLLICGPRSRVLRHCLPGTHRVGVTLRPGYLEHTLGVAPEEVVDSLGEVAIKKLHVPDHAWQSEVHLLAFVKSLLCRMNALHTQSAVEALVRNLPAPRNDSVHAWACGANLTERTLHRHCLKFFGMPPKAYLRAQRLAFALQSLVRESTPTDTLSEAAHEAGYADQAHFCHDCRSLLYCSPQKAIQSLGLFFRV